MNYPHSVAIYKQELLGNGFGIHIREKKLNYNEYDVVAEIPSPDYYEAKDAEELLVFLMGVYDWYPEGYEA